MCHVSPPKIRSYTTPLPIPRYVILNVTQGFLCSYFKINFDLFPVTHTYVYGFYLLCCHFICDLGITDKVQKCQKSRNHPVTITCQNDRFYTAHQHYRVIRHLKSYLSLTSKHKLCFSLKLLKLYTKMSLLIFKSIMQKVTLTLTDTASIGSAWFPSVETSALILTSVNRTEGWGPRGLSNHQGYKYVARPAIETKRGREKRWRSWQRVACHCRGLTKQRTIWQ